MIKTATLFTLSKWLLKRRLHGPTQPPLNSLLRKLPDGDTGVQIAILKSCNTSTATIDGQIAERYNNDIRDF